jgi:pimeloyl-ACP methyl ester carboxylesterase
MDTSALDHGELGRQRRELMVASEAMDGTMAHADALAEALRAGMPVDERRLELAGVSTPVLEGGAGPPVVLLHGQGAFAESWGPVIPQLARSHRVIAPDLPGLGRSFLRPGAPDGPMVMAWLASLIEQTCVDRPTVVGVSLGGTVSAHFAIAHPESTRRIVLIASGSLGPFRPSPAALLALIRYVRNPSPATNDRFFRHMVHDPERARSAMGERRAMSQAYHIDRTKQPSVRAANRALVRWSAHRIPSDQLRSIAVPVALIWGRDDRIMRFKTAEKASAEFGWPLYPIEDCGHYSLADQPAALLEALTSALAVGE